jgi:hypothetical protein
MFCSKMEPRTKAFSGAGFLLWDYHPTTGKIMFLLGKEYRPNERDHDTFSDFGGGPDPGEDPLATAIRECEEESMGFIKIKLPWNKGPIVSYVCGRPPRCFYIFLLQYKYQSNIVTDYHLFWEKALSEGRVMEGNGLYEKSELRWFSLDEILDPRNTKLFRKSFLKDFKDIYVK